jgi:integrase
MQVNLGVIVDQNNQAYAFGVRLAQYPRVQPGEVRVVTKRQMRLDEAVEEYKRRRATSLKPNTRTTLWHRLDEMVRYLGPKRLLVEITRDECELAFTAPESPIITCRCQCRIGHGPRCRNGRPKTPNTVNTTHSTWVHFFGFCHERAWLQANPMSLVKPRKKTPRGDDRVYLSGAELLHLISLAKYAPHLILMTLQANSGLRISEVQALKVGDIDLANGYFIATILKLSAEGDEPLRVEMPITAQLDRALREWLPQYAAIVGALKAHYPLVPSLQYNSSRRGGTTWNVNRYPDDSPKPTRSGSAIVHSYMEQAGYYVKGQASHVLRRSAARILWDALAETEGETRATEVVQEFLNHMDPSTTLGYIGRKQGRRRMLSTLRGRPFLDLAAAEDAPKLGVVRNG